MSDIVPPLRSIILYDSADETSNSVGAFTVVLVVRSVTYSGNSSFISLRLSE